MSAFFVDRIALPWFLMVYNNSVPLSASMAATMRTPKRRTRAMYMFRRFLFFGPCVAVFGPLPELAGVGTGEHAEVSVFFFVKTFGLQGARPASWASPLDAPPRGWPWRDRTTTSSRG